jgi:hypothetical protein
MRHGQGRIYPWVRLVLTAGSFAAAGYLTLARSLSNPPPAVAIILVTSAAVLLGAVLPSIQDARFGREAAIEREVAVALGGAFLALVTKHEMPAGDLRLHFFSVQRPFWAFPPFQEALIRRGYFGLKFIRPFAKVRWTKGKGVIGEVWSDANIAGVAKDVSMAAPVNTEAEWRRLADAERRNMSWKEYQGARHNQVVYAQAVLDDQARGGVVAVISADTGSTQLNTLNDPDVKDLLGAAGQLAWKIVRKAK